MRRGRPHLAGGGDGDRGGGLAWQESKGMEQLALQPTVAPTLLSPHRVARTGNGRGGVHIL